MKNIRLKIFKIILSIKMNPKLVTLKSFTIQFFKKTTLKKKILKNQLLLSNIFKNWQLTITKTIPPS